MSSYYSCWSVKPTDGQPGMAIEEVLARLASAFPVHTFDREAGRQHALERLAALQAVTSVPMPEEMLSYYRNAYPVDVVLGDGPHSAASKLKFSVWPDPEGPVTGVLVYFANEEEQIEGCVLLVRMAVALGWHAEDASDEIE